MSGYETFLASKKPSDPATGLISLGSPVAPLFDFQRDIVRWALWRGRAAIFADCGLGKTPMSLEWARAVSEHTGQRVLILAPLAVALQTVQEGQKFGIPVQYARKSDDILVGGPRISPRIVATNYERLEAFDPSEFGGVVSDESSILKAYDSATRNLVIETFRDTPYRLACTATPAPNDFMELGNHAEFLGAMTRAEMLAMFFVHDGGETQTWRLKGHAESEFWGWVASWAVMIRKPSDLGYADDGFVLPTLRYHSHVVESAAPEGSLLPVQAATLPERRQAARESISARVAACAEMVNGTPGPWVVWCHLNDESSALAAAIPGAVEVRGSMSLEDKEAAVIAFTRGEIRVLVTKPSISGFGMNWQHCHQTAFVGLSDSWEEYYQATRRFWRFGQTRDVDVHVITAESEGAVVANIRRKDEQASAMALGMLEHMHAINAAALQAGGLERDIAVYARDVATGDDWTMHLGDCVEVARELPEASVDFSVFSPPFASLYTYSNSPRDMGNTKSHGEFFEHLAFLIPELYRIIKPGRLCSVHCMNLPTSKVRDGVIGLSDFRGEIIRAFQAAGWVYHSEVCIWKDPVTAMQRTKALGLLHKQIRKDSAMSRQGIPDYLVTFRKPGDNAEPIAHASDAFPVSLWQRYASPVWMDINPSDTLQFRSAREHQDERHIAPLQLTVIRRALELWTNPGDTVFSPFGGIASEGVVALESGRRYLGVELKRSYWTQAVRNLASANQSTGVDLFAAIGESA